MLRRCEADASLVMTLLLKRTHAAEEGAYDVKKAPTGRERKEGGMGEGGRDAGGMERGREGGTKK